MQVETLTTKRIKKISVQVYKFLYTHKKINTARPFMNKIPSVPIFFLKTDNSVH